MIALIPGLTDTLAYLRPQQPPAPPRQEGFPQMLASAAEAGPTSTPATPPALPRYEVQPGDNLTRIAKKLGYADPYTLARANGLKDANRLQIGQVLTLPEKTAVSENRVVTPKTKPAAARPATAPTRSRSRGRQLVVASWYGSWHHGKLMANGQPFDMHADTVAHKKLPLGTRLTLTNPQNGTTVKVRVTDRGPYIPGRNLDLSHGVARKLGVVQAGVAKVWMEGG